MHKSVEQSHSAADKPLGFQPFRAELIDALATVLKGSWGSSCWCMYPRLSDKQIRALPGEGSAGARKRQAMLKLANRKWAPGLVAFQGEEPIGWIAVAPRAEYGRITHSRATPPVDNTGVWVIPCITVRKTARGQGAAVALIRAAVDYAKRHGAPCVEAYPRAGNERTQADNVYFGTEALFAKAGFHLVRPPLEGLPRNWLKRVTMRSN